MTRKLYLGTLAWLQAALAWHVAPLVAQLLQQRVRPGTALHAWALIAQIGCAALCVLAAALAISYPAIALMRHAQAGPQRFAALPEWAVLASVCGAAMLAADAALRAFVPPHALGPEELPFPLAVPLAPAGIALMTAGVLLAELLRAGAPSRASVTQADGPPTGATATLTARPRAIERAA